MYLMLRIRFNWIFLATLGLIFSLIITVVRWLDGATHFVILGLIFFFSFLVCILLLVMASVLMLVILLPFVNARLGLGIVSYELHSQGIKIETYFSEEKIKWVGIEKITLASNYIYIQKSLAHFIIIPRRFFNTDTEFSKFYRLLNDGYLRSRELGV